MPGTAAIPAGLSDLSLGPVGRLPTVGPAAFCRTAGTGQRRGYRHSLSVACRRGAWPGDPRPAAQSRPLIEHRARASSAFRKTPRCTQPLDLQAAMPNFSTRFVEILDAGFIDKRPGAIPHLDRIDGHTIQCTPRSVLHHREQKPSGSDPVPVSLGSTSRHGKGRGRGWLT